MKTNFVMQSKWRAIICLATLSGVIWQVIHGVYDEKLYSEGDWPNMALIAGGTGAYWCLLVLRFCQGLPRGYFRQMAPTRRDPK